jgi:hypothetical protein
VAQRAAQQACAVQRVRHPLPAQPAAGAPGGERAACAGCRRCAPARCLGRGCECSTHTCRCVCRTCHARQQPLARSARHAAP